MTNSNSIINQKFVERIANDVLDTFVVDDLTLREWKEKIISGEYQPVKHGFWEPIILTSYPAQQRYQCSQCFALKLEKSKYCPDCGAEMTDNAKIEMPCGTGKTALGVMINEEDTNTI